MRHIDSIRGFAATLAVLICTPKVITWAVYPLHPRGRLIIRQWIADRMRETARWVDLKSDKVAPTASERARAGMDE